MDTLKQIKTFLNQKGIKKQVSESTEFKDLGLDSLDLMDLIISAEKKFKIAIPDDQLILIKTVSDLINIIESKK